MSIKPNFLNDKSITISNAQYSNAHNIDDIIHTPIQFTSIEHF